MPSIEQLSDNIGVRVKGVDLSAQLGVDDFDFIYQSLVEHKAVSYTHLRAHETLRYLVCRLLLEKKK